MRAPSLLAVAGCAAVTAVAACGSPGARSIGSGGAGGDEDSSTGSGSTGPTTTTSVSAGPGGGAQPPPPGGGGPGDGPGAVFAISRLLFGDTDRDGTPNVANGWKQYGFNLDDKISTKDSNDLCKPNSGGAPSAVYPDGVDGIDNSFGKNILPIYLGLAPDWSEQFNASILDGSYTLLVDIQALGPKSSYDPLLARQYRGAPLAQPPKLDGSDVWPVTAESLSAPGDLASAKTQFGQSYLAADVWVSGPPAQVVIDIVAGGLTLRHRLHRAIVTMKLTPDRSAATFGTIAGILDTEEFISDWRDAAGAFDPGLCSGSTFESLANQIRQASDVLIDGSQSPLVECNGISVGFGFDAKRVILGPVASPQPPQPDPCDGF